MGVAGDGATHSTVGVTVEEMIELEGMGLTRINVAAEGVVIGLGADRSV